MLAQKNTLDQDEEDFDSLASDLDADDFEDNYEDDLDAPRLLIINGPNINMLGIREPEIYGKADYRTLIEACKEEALSQGFSDCVCYQSNHEGDLVDAYVGRAEFLADEISEIVRVIDAVAMRDEHGLVGNRLACLFNGRTAQPLGPTPAPG